jgi:hypothetical protein
MTTVSHLRNETELVVKLSSLSWLTALSGSQLPIIFHALKQIKSTLHSAQMPNPSLRLTRYGSHCRPGQRYFEHCLSPGLQHPPQLSAISISS